MIRRRFISMRWAPFAVTPLAAAALITTEPIASGQPGLAKLVHSLRLAKAEAPSRLDDPAGIHNLWRFAPGVYSGSMPEAGDGFDSLATLGVRTIVSVDGARPDLENARPRGMRYVHVPIRYSGMTPEEQFALIKALRDMPRPIYVHCHHGKHRGPAAAALGLVATAEMEAELAVKLMERVGTSPSYSGLYECVGTAAPIDDVIIDRFAPELTEHARVTGFVAAMAAIDRNWDNLKLLRDNEWSAPPDHPDLVAAAEASMLHDHLRAATEDPEAEDRPADFREWLEKSLADSKRLETALVNLDRRAAHEAMDAVGKSCKDCHVAYRND